MKEDALPPNLPPPRTFPDAARLSLWRIGAETAGSAGEIPVRGRRALANGPEWGRLQSDGFCPGAVKPEQMRHRKNVQICCASG